MPKITSFSHWITWLKSTELGALWLLKFEFDLKSDNLPKTTEPEFIAAVESSLLSLGPVASPLAVIDYATRRNSLVFELQSQKLPKVFEPLSCVVKLAVFSHYYLRRRSLITIVDEGDDEMNYVWDNLGKTITPTFYEGRLRTDKEFFWCAPTSDLDRLQRTYSPHRAATTIRTRLGLQRIAKGERLIRIDIPTDSLRSRRVLPPTTLDGGTNSVFVPCNSADGYGRTLNLITNTRDIKELICEAIDFTPRFKALRIGQVDADVPPFSIEAVKALL
jgi:hypothetical protein